MNNPPFIVITLERKPERSAGILASLPRDTDVTFLPAIDGEQLSTNPPWEFDNKLVMPWADWIDPYSRRALTLGEVGCTLSHVAAWKKVVELDKPTIILEDDARPYWELFPADWPEVVRDLQSISFDLCYLAQRNNPGPKLLTGRMTHRVDYHPLWTLAYMLTPAGAEKLLSTPWSEYLIPSDELIPAAFGLNHDSSLNNAFAVPGNVVATNQRMFYSAVGSEGSTTEKSRAVRTIKTRLTALTVATELNTGIHRLLDTGERYGLDFVVLGLEQEWRGGDIANEPGGGQKINLLRPMLEQLEPNEPVLFVDGYDVVITSHAADILDTWHKICQERPLFAAEVHCWPEPNLTSNYPERPTPYRFLNSGAFIGYAGALLNMINFESIEDHHDDQLYYTLRYLARIHDIVLDHHCDLFQCLNGSLEDVVVDEGRGQIFNQRTNTWPMVVHANGPTKQWLEGAGRSVGGRWRTFYGDMSQMPLAINRYGSIDVKP